MIRRRSNQKDWIEEMGGLRYFCQRGALCIVGLLDIFTCTKEKKTLQRSMKDRFDSGLMVFLLPKIGRFICTVRDVPNGLW